MVLIILSLVAALIARSPLIPLRHPPFLPAQFLLFSTPIADLSCPSFQRYAQSNSKRGYVYFNQRFGVSAIAMQKLGVFNAKIGVDNKMFVDPKLLNLGRVRIRRRSRRACQLLLGDRATCQID